MNHIRFVSTNKTVCQAPNQLGHDFIVIDYSPGESCQSCLALILRHNQRERQYDLLVSLPEREDFAPYDDKQAAARGLLNGLVIASVFWIVVAVLLWYMGVFG